MTRTGVSVTCLPELPYLEQGEDCYLLHADFVVKNRSAYELALEDITVVVHETNEVIYKRHLDANGLPPGSATIPGFPLQPGQSVTLFNPLERFPRALPLTLLRYEFTLCTNDGAKRWTDAVELAPRTAPDHVELHLPVRGHILVYEAHDYYGHHRRLDLRHPAIWELGLRYNSSRYSYDLSVVDEKARMYRSDGTRNEDWYSWEQPVLAAGSGIVTACANDREDFKIGQAGFQFPGGPMRDPSLFLGNYITIQHAEGIYSMTGHCQKGSVQVRPGDHVSAGQQIGRVGFSGSCVTVHTHFQLQEGPTFNSEGVPSQFTRFRRIRGAGSVEVPKGTIDSGEIIESLN